MPTLTTFNANNFFLRYKFTNKYPGDLSGHSLVDAAEAGLVGYLPGLAFSSIPSTYIIWDRQRRELANRALREPDGQLPDILCLQEVENLHAIRYLDQKFLGNFYSYSLRIDSKDTRNIDVGLMSRFPIRRVRSHIDDLNNQGARIFSRDCLEAEIELPGNEILYLFLNHFKSKFVRRNANESDADYNERVKRSHQRRESQAEAVRDHLRERFPGQNNQALYAVVGDFNDTPHSPWLNPLLSLPNLVDVVSEHRTSNDRWTYFYRSRGRVTQIDYILASPALADRVRSTVIANPGRVPHIERQGLAYRELNNAGLVLPKKANLIHLELDNATTPQPNAPPDEKVDFRFPRYPEVLQGWRNNASDHCPVKVWF